MMDAAPAIALEPYWWDDAAPRNDERRRNRPASADVVVVGGGYTGLACALELARRGVAVCVVEAERIGFGASSRNGGLVAGGIKLALTLQASLTQRLGRDRAEAIAREAVGTLGFLENLLEREGIACHYRRGGRFMPAYAKRHYAQLAAQAERIQGLVGGAVEMVPAARQREELGSDHYHGGMLISESATLHPALFVQGLAEAAERAGATLVDHAEVSALKRRNGGFDIETSRGPIRAGAVMVATNGYTGRFAQSLRRRVIPVESFIIATESLPPEMARRLIPRDRAVADTKRVLSYFRLSPDGRRLLWGGRVGFGVTPTGAALSAGRLRALMLQVFPELRDVRITHSWKGNVAFTFDQMPHLGCLDGLFYALGCQGSGVAMQTWLGTCAAAKIAGGGNQTSAFDGLPFPTLPFYDGRPWFLPLAGNWYRLRDWMDRRAG
jgi:glycine/D-amino acid oxidase-like deaminating enzyme